MSESTHDYSVDCGCDSCGDQAIRDLEDERGLKRGTLFDAKYKHLAEGSES